MPMLSLRIRGVAAATSVGLLLASCNGSSPTVTGTTNVGSLLKGASVTQTVLLEGDMSRLAKQATFGATPALISHMEQVGVNAWLDEQFAATGSTYADIAADKRLWNSCGSDTACNHHYFSREPVAMRFYANAIGKPDQLRQRVAFALSQLMVASTVKINHGPGVAALNQIFLDNAFGNFRTLLGAVTMNGFMGFYLDMGGSNKANPNENYAREMMQLFTMGTNKLNMDGSPIKDATGGAVPNYTSDDVHSIARALTGWTYSHFKGGSDYTDLDYAAPMVANAAAYDSTAKTFLGVTVAAGASQTTSVNTVLDAAFNNPSTAPYIAKFLIQQLVSSNPSPAYIGRVAAVFANNGSNVRGDMKAVIRAILTDAEARGSAGTVDNYGKVKEPVLLMTGLARAIGMATDGVVFMQRDSLVGEPVFNAPSVFNFYPPDFPLPQSGTLTSPATKLMTNDATVQRSNFLYSWTYGAVTPRAEMSAAAGVIGATGSALDWSSWEAFGTDVDGMIDRVDLLLASRMLTDAQKAALKTAATAITNTNPTTQARMRAQALLYIVASSPLFQVDR